MRPQAVALLRTDENVEQGMYGSVILKTPANGSTIIAKVKPGEVATIRAYAASIERAA